MKTRLTFLATFAVVLAIVFIPADAAKGEYKRVLVSAGSVWKYYASNHKPAAQSGTEWYKPSYDDESPVEWPSGLAQLGYSEGSEVEKDELTVIPFCSHGPGCDEEGCKNNKYITSYYRHYFYVEDKSDYSSLRVRLLRDDGAVVYLNGDEISRQNLPYPAEITYGTFADDGISQGNEDKFYDEENVSIDYLQNGTNVLAVEIHQVTVGSSDISFDLVLDDGTTGMIAGPYLIYTNYDEKMDVFWILDSEQTCKLEWDDDENFTDPLVGYNYNIGRHKYVNYGHQYRYTMNNLSSPSTKYYYRLTDGSDNEYLGSFYSAPDEDAKNVKFLAYGDTRSSTKANKPYGPLPYGHNLVCWAINDTLTIDPDYQTFLLLAGDWVNKGNVVDDWHDQYFSRYFAQPQKLQANLPIMGCPGNHEFDSSMSTLFPDYWPYDEIDWWPEKTNHMYYYFDYGPVRVVVADQYVYGNYPTTNRMGNDGEPPYDFENNVQLNWIKDTLSESPKKWNILLLHQPYYTAGNHEISDSPRLEDEMDQLFVTGGDWDIRDDVDIVIAGHNHYYARCLENGIHHITTGGSGAPLTPPDLPDPDNNIWASAEKFHHCVIDVTNNLLTLSSRDNDGVDFDRVELCRFPTNHDDYNTWVDVGKPACWCYPRQCRGDVDGVKTGDFWVAIPDLNIFRSAFNKTDLQLAGIANGICADLDHTKTGPFRVAIPDLNIFRLYFNMPEAQVPLCDTCE